MSAVDDLFQNLRASGCKAFMPFVTAGDPDLDFTRQVLQALITAGSSLCEVGIPYSDPIADGPVIQSSFTRALEQGVKLADIFQMMRSWTPRPTAPLVSMLSYAIVCRYGLERYVDDARTAGFAGAIVPDLLVEESEQMAQVCRQRDFSLIQLVTPTTSRERALRIAAASSGFLYYVSVTGITGERRRLPPELLDQVGWLRERTSLPICIGFGISEPQHVRSLAPVADGVIVGSAIVRRVARMAEQGSEAVLADVSQLADKMIAALPSVASS